jgi:hypothetical protein
MLCYWKGLKEFLGKHDSEILHSVRSPRLDGQLPRLERRLVVPGSNMLLHYKEEEAEWIIKGTSPSSWILVSVGHYGFLEGETDTPLPRLLVFPSA